MKKLYFRVLNTAKRLMKKLLVLFRLRSGEPASIPSDAEPEDIPIITLDPAPFGKVAWKQIKKKMGQEFCTEMSGRVTKQIKEIDEHFAEASYGLDTKFYADEIVAELVGGSVCDYFIYRLAKRGYRVGIEGGKFLITKAEGGHE